jgi:hypothetical protein
MRGALRSAIANRQWPQQRCFKAGFAVHPKCIFCVYAAAANPATDAAEPLHLPPPSPVQIEAAPVGNCHHRIWLCPRLDSSRRRHAPIALRPLASSADASGDVALERALFPSLAAEVPPPKDEATFNWVVMPPGGTFRGAVYSDGSRLDGPSQLLARNGWAFVVMNPAGEVMAAANGVTPRWIDDIPGAEAWALTQAATRAEPGCTYRVDCEPCVKAVHRGRAWATSDRRPHARVNVLMHSALDGTAAEAVVWMPSHKGEADIGVVKLGDGTYLTHLDLAGNAEADRLAKLAVEEHRVPEWIVATVRKQDVLVEATARWIALATFEANHQAIKPLRNSDSSRSAAIAAARLRRDATRQPVRRTVSVVTRPSAQGGHTLQRRGEAWEFRVCKRRSRLRSKLAPQRCVGSVVKRWEIKAQTFAGNGQVRASGHARVMSGEVIWCIRCGSYAESAAKGLAKRCRGKFQGNGVNGGVVGQLKALIAGRRPVTGAQMPPPIPEARWCGNASSSCADLRVSCTPGPLVSVGGGAVQGNSRFTALRERIRAKEGAARALEPRGDVVEASTMHQSGQLERRRITGKRKARTDILSEPDGVQIGTAANGFVRSCKRRKCLGDCG